MSGGTASRPSADPDLRRNFNLLVLDGTFFMAGSAFYDASTVIPAFVSTLTSSQLTIGFVATMRSIGWFLPQLVVANLTQGLRRKSRLIIINSLLQRGALVLMALITYLYAEADPGLALALFLPVFVLSSLSEGINGVPWTDVVANTIPAERRGRLFGYQQIYGGILALLGGLLVRHILEAAPYPDRYSILFLCTAAGFLLSIVTFMGVREKPAPVIRQRQGLPAYFRSLPTVWRSNRAFSKVMEARFCMAFLFLSQPFFVIHARQNLGVEIGTLGFYVSAQMLGTLIGSAIAGHLSDRSGSRMVVISALSTAFLAPASALAITALYGWGAESLAVALYPLIYFFMGSTFGGGYIGFTNYVIDVAPSGERPTLIGLMNTLLAPFAFLGAIGGLLAALLGYETVFAISAGFGLFGVILAWRLREPRMDPAWSGPGGPLADSAKEAAAIAPN